jgi:MoaA/NifB/PqqE/SkfB family radical SAM enzyme
VRRARRLLGLAGRIAGSNLRRPRLPLKLTFILTYVCDCRCAMCNIWKRRDKGGMTAEEVDRFFGSHAGFPWVNLSGGEIFAHPEIDGILAAVARTNRRIYLIDFPTTGQRTERIVPSVERLLGFSPPRVMVTVSLDGPGTKHDEIRGRRGAFENCIRTFLALRGLRAKNLFVYFGVTLSRFNRGELFAIFESVRERIPGIRYGDFHVNLAQESAHYYQNVGLGPPPEREALRDIDEFLRRKGRGFHPVAFLESTYQRLLGKFLRTRRSPLPCAALHSSLFIDPHWTVYPCSMWDAPLGNLRDAGFSLDRLWNSAETLARRAEVVAEKCPHCWTPCEAYQTILANLGRTLPGL